MRGITHRISSSGTLHIKGEMLNGTDDNLKRAVITGSFYDAEGQLAGSTFTYAWLDIVEAGDTTPFHLLFMNPPAEIASYELQLEYRTTDEMPIQVEILEDRAHTYRIRLSNLPSPAELQGKSVRIYTTAPGMKQISVPFRLVGR